MGLDMYLTKEVYIGGKYKHRKVSGLVSITIDEKKIRIPVKRIDTINLEIGYWRKANHIHRWFVENVQEGEDDCKSYYIGDNQLKELKDLCEQVLKDHSLAKSLLPTCDGSFFGSVKYDDYYFESLEETIEIIDRHLNDEITGDCSYRSSW